ncbi:hypothetical protein MKD41_14935 [Lutibacter sp. A64]|uniref:hypothetical protein n=1 Tax=Lutibacter sp. A64 TaxID=2918526 RepID=UPI001F068D0E|nr:hypothetical protein [Lutibacter sp. A64]UMB53617.1 hypothetical protein MKD41_14935 [Lutibacter sp. A64]
MKFFYLLCFLITTNALAQHKNVSNKKYFKIHLKSDEEKNIIILGENHASAVAASIFPTIVKYLNRTNDLNKLIIECGPSEAFFYNKFLNTGNEKHLNYTIFCGSYQPWLEAWRTIYNYNKRLKKTLTVIGVDFDRARTMGYALISVFYKYKNPPTFISSLMDEIKTNEFYNTYTSGYPTKKDLEWMSKVKKTLKSNKLILKQLLKTEDYNLIQQIIKNKTLNYNNEREQALADNTKRIIKNTNAKNFLILMGRSHAYYKSLIKKDKQMLAAYLKNEPSFNLLTGAIIFEGSNLRTPYNKNLKETALFEISDKLPWKDFYNIINKKAKHKLTLIPLKKELNKLNCYLDYIIVAKKQAAITLRK